MSIFGDSDLPTFMADFGVDITYAGQTKKGIKDAYDEREQALAGVVDIVERLTIVTVPYNAFTTALAIEAAVTVDGVSMKIRDIMQLNDGGLAKFAAVPA